MTKTEKDRIINEIMDRLIMLTEDDYKTGKATDGGRAEMLTIKECVSAVSGVSEHSIRKIVTQGKVKYVRSKTNVSPQASVIPRRSFTAEPQTA